MRTPDLTAASAAAPLVPPAPEPVDFPLPVLLGVFVVAAVTSYVCRRRLDQSAAHEEGSGGDR